MINKVNRRLMDLGIDKPQEVDGGNGLIIRDRVLGISMPVAGGNVRAVALLTVPGTP